jgi:hypothetical protein
LKIYNFINKFRCVSFHFLFEEAPPEVFDNRTLYEKLQEQHEMKKKEFEDSYALS